MSENFINKADKFIETYRSLLLALAIALGLLSLYQNYQAKQLRWVDGWSCQYWDAQKNSFQKLIEGELTNAALGYELNTQSLYSFTKKRDEAAEKVNLHCLPAFADENQG